MFQKAHCSALFALLVFSAACGDENGGTLILRADGSTEARTGIPAEQTADGWAVEFDHAIIVLGDFELATGLGDNAMLSVDSVAAELVREPVVAHRIENIPAQRWDRASYFLRPPTANTRSEGVDQDLLDRMVRERWSNYYAGRLIAPSGTVDADGNAVTVIPFEFGFPIEVAYEACVAGNDGTNGVVIPVQSAVDYEVTWHLTHIFFDSFAEDSALRVEPLAARWNGQTPLSIDDLDVPLGGLRGIGGRPLLDQRGDPVVYIPGMTGANTLREFVLNARFGHFNGLEGFCMTTLSLLE